MNLEDLIKKLILEGKSDEEIASEVSKHTDGKKMTVDAIAEKIQSLQNEKEIVSKLTAFKKAKADADAAAKAESEAEKKVETLVENKLKSIGVNPLGRFSANQDLKQFNLQTGKFDDVKAPSELYAKANDMLVAILTGDVASAKSMSKEIELENLKSRSAKFSRMGIKATPTVSDVTTRGGYSIPTEVDDMITQMIYAESVMLQRANKETIIVNDKIYPVMYGMSVGYIADQSTAATETNPTFYNPTVAMKRIGGFSAIANKIISQKGADLMNAFMLAYKSNFARFLDLHMAVGNVTTQADAQDGIFFDPLTVVDTDVALASLTLQDLADMVGAISQEADGLTWVCNRKVKQKIGLLENTGGFNLFPQFIGGGVFSPLGIPLLENVKIPSVLDIGADARLAGTDDAIGLVDFSKFAVGIDSETRIDLSTDFFFTADATVLRGIRSVGWKVLLGNTQASGGVARVRGLTN